MSAAQTIEQNNSLIRLPNSGYTDEQFFEFCMLNRNFRIERQASGKIIVLAPTSISTGGKNADLTISA